MSTGALAHAKQRLQDRYDNSGRVVPAPRDDELFERRIQRRLVAEAAAVIDADPACRSGSPASSPRTRASPARPSDVRRVGRHDRGHRRGLRDPRRSRPGSAGAHRSAHRLLDRDRAAVNRRTRRSKRWRKPWGLGGAWAGRENVKKSVYGYFIHVLTRSDPDGPRLVEMFCVAPANVHARGVGLPLMHRIQRGASPTRAFVPQSKPTTRATSATCRPTRRTPTRPNGRRPCASSMRAR